MPGIQELIVIAVVALLVLGPSRLPEVARNGARLLSRLRAETQRSVDELKRAAAVDGLDSDLRDLGRELRETRDAVSRPFAGGDGAVRDRAPRADDRPPPVDLEAT